MRASFLTGTLLAAGWGCAVAAGGWLLMAYASSPGRAAAAPAGWPADSSVPPSADRLTLLVFAHPECPCTRATLDELEWLVSRCRTRLAVHVLFVPTGLAGKELAELPLVRRAESLAGVQVRPDPEAAEARRFGAATSGQVLLYDPGGQLLFRGGLTPARGHAGDCLGREAVYRLARGEPAAATSAPVFGCPLYPTEERDPEP